jgi:hypothetical protein
MPIEDTIELVLALPACHGSTDARSVGARVEVEAGGVAGYWGLE